MLSTRIQRVLATWQNRIGVASFQRIQPCFPAAIPQRAPPHPRSFHSTYFCQTLHEMQPKLLPLALCSLPASLAQPYSYLLSPLPAHTYTHTHPCVIIKLGLTMLWSLSIFKSYVELTFEIQQPSPSITRQRDDHTFSSAGHITSHPTLCTWT